MFQTIPMDQLVAVGSGDYPASTATQSGSLHSISRSSQLPLNYQPYAAYSVLACTNTFGAGSIEEAIAEVVFAGQTNGDQTPTVLFFTAFNASAAGGWYAGTNQPTLAQAQALSGEFSIVIDGRTVTTASINLSAATSLAQVATLITTGLQTPAGVFSGLASQTASSSQMTVTEVISGVLHIGDLVTGTGVAAGTTITAFGTGTGGTGTYTVSNTTGFSATTIDVGSLATCGFDSIQSVFEIDSATVGPNSSVNTGTDITGTILGTLFANPQISVGAVPAVPATFFQNSYANFQGYTTLMLSWVPTVSEGLTWATAVNSVAPGKVIFPIAQQDIAYVNGQNLTGTLKAAVAGIPNIPVTYDPTGYEFPAGLGTYRAAINYDADSSTSSDPSFKSFPGMTAQVTNGTQSANLIANQVMFYGSFSSTDASKTWMVGDWNSGDVASVGAAYDQIAFDSECQSALVTWRQRIKRFPYNPPGFAACRGVITGGPVQWAFNNGIIQVGVTLSSSERNSIIQACGGITQAADDVQNKGVFVYVADPGPDARQAGDSPIILIPYTSGGRVLFLKATTVLAQ